MHRAKLLLLLVVGACGGAAPQAQIAEQREVLTLHRIAPRFCGQVQSLGHPLPYCPEVREWTRPSLVSWREEARAVAVPSWSEVPDGVRVLMTEIAPGQEQEFFELLFRWFLVPHELTHFLQTVHPGAADHYTSEALANDVAVAFWKEQPGGPERLASLRAHVERAIALLPLPAEANDDPAGYFHRNYHTLGQNPRVYGAFQFRMIHQAIARQEQLHFKSLVNALFGEVISRACRQCGPAGCRSRGCSHSSEITSRAPTVGSRWRRAKSVTRTACSRHQERTWK